jgi:hypothetical protein
MGGAAVPFEFGSWASAPLAYTVLNRIKPPEGVDEVPLTTTLRDAENWNIGVFSPDYYMYTNKETPSIVLQIADLYPNGKGAEVTVVKSNASAKASSNASDGTKLTGELIAGEGVSYARLQPTFENVEGGGNREWVVYRVTVRNFEGTSFGLGTDGDGMLANGKPHGTDAAGNILTTGVDEKGVEFSHDNGGAALRQHPDAKMVEGTADPSVLSFTIYVSYYNEPITVGPDYTGGNSSLNGGGERDWARNGLLSRYIGNRITGELSTGDCYYYQRKAGDVGVLDESYIKANGKPWPSTQWQVGVNNVPGTIKVGETKSGGTYAFVDGETAYIHLLDRFGNREGLPNAATTVEAGGATTIVPLRNFDQLEPSSEQAGNTLIVTEHGGAGFYSVQLYQYSLSGGPGYLQMKPEAGIPVWNAQHDEAKFSDVPIADAYGRMDVMITDRTGNQHVGRMSGLTVKPGNLVDITVKLIDEQHTFEYPKTVLASQGFFLESPLALLEAAVSSYPVELNGQAEEAFAPQTGVLAVAEPEYENGVLRLKVLTVGAVESLMVKSAATGQSITYKPSNAVRVESGYGGTKIWTLEGDFAAGNVWLAAKIDGDWSELAELVPVAELPAMGGDSPNPGEGGSQSAEPVEPVDPNPIEDPADPVDPADPAQGEGTAAPADGDSGTAAPARKSFLKVLLEWLLGVFAVR